MLQNYADAEDITQDALVKAYQSLSQLREAACLRPVHCSSGNVVRLKQLRHVQREHFVEQADKF